MFVTLYILFLLIFGTLNTLTTKWQFSESAVGIFGVEKTFNKPWWGNFVMFVAMALVLVIYYLQMLRTDKNSAPDNAYRPLGARVVSPIRSFMYIGVPAVLDLIGSGLTLMGLVHINASVWQMLRGSNIIFAAALSVPLLKRTLHAYHCVGVVLCVFGICCVGMACVMSNRHGKRVYVAMHGTTPELHHVHASAVTSESTMGCLLVLLGQVVQAAQLVVEEKLLKHVHLPGMLIVGVEGIWGTVVMFMVVFPLFQWIPGNDSGSYENTMDTVVMIENNVTLQALVVLYLISCCTYNLARMFVTNSLSAVHFTMIDASRTCLIWILNLCVFYYGTGSIRSFGESLTPWSPLQAFGFVVLLYGQSVYGGLIKLPFKSFYPENYQSAQVETMASFYASPACLRSSIPTFPYSPVNRGSTSPQRGWLNSPKYLSFVKDSNPFTMQGAQGL